MNQLAGKKTKKHTLFTYALGKIKLFRVKESVYFQKLVKYSTRSESHPPSSTDYSEVCIAHAQMKMKVGQNQCKQIGTIYYCEGMYW